MSRENVEVVRRIYEAWNRVDLGLEFFDPAFELHQTPTLVDTDRVFRGHDGLLQAVRELFSGLRDLSWHPDDFLVAPDNQVVVPFRFKATGRSQGVTVEMKLVHVWAVDDGLAIRCITYEALTEALEAAGLRD